LTSALNVHAAISYAHGRYDTEILALANRLNQEGIDCELDLYDDAPPQGWPQWMLDTLEKRVVIAVCTAEYADRVAGRTSPGVGRGVAWEGRILKGRVYDGQGRNEGIVPVVFSADDVCSIPDFLKDVTYYDLSRIDGYELLYRRLTRQPRYVKPPLGTVRDLSSSVTATTNKAAVRTMAALMRERCLPGIVERHDAARNARIRPNSNTPKKGVAESLAFIRHQNHKLLEELVHSGTKLFIEDLPKALSTSNGQAEAWIEECQTYLSRLLDWENETHQATLDPIFDDVQQLLVGMTAETFNYIVRLPTVLDELAATPEGELPKIGINVRFVDAERTRLLNEALTVAARRLLGGARNN
jgi:hypothetical protein